MKKLFLLGSLQPTQNREVRNWVRNRILKAIVKSWLSAARDSSVKDAKQVVPVTFAKD